MRTRDIAVGQRYRGTEAGWLVWEVVAIIPDSLNVPHARIAAVSIREERTVACSVLADPRRFRRLDETVG
jgi:hypothetical protein